MIPHVCGFRLPVQDRPQWDRARPPVDVFVHQSKLRMDGFWSLEEGNKSAKGLKCIAVTRPDGLFCIGSARQPKGKNVKGKQGATTAEV